MLYFGLGVAPLGRDGSAGILTYCLRNYIVSFEYKPLLREIIVGMFHTVPLKTSIPN